MTTNKHKYTVTVIPDEEVEAFSPSSCTCKTCILMHVAQLEWDTFKPETRLQFRMKEVISKIEGDIAAGKKSNLRSIPKRLSKKR